MNNTFRSLSDGCPTVVPVTVTSCVAGASRPGAVSAATKRKGLVFWIEARSLVRHLAKVLPLVMTLAKLSGAFGRLWAARRNGASAQIIAVSFIAMTLHAAAPADLERKADLESLKQIRSASLRVAVAQAALEAEIDKFNGIVRVWQDKCRAKGGVPNVDGFTNPRCVAPPQPSQSQQQSQPPASPASPLNPTTPKTQ